MAFSRFVFTVLLLCVACRASVPVFIWGNVPAPILKSNPLTITTTPAFSDILSEELSEDPFTVVFIEETLSIEDFSRRNVDGKSSLQYLHENLHKSVYLPSVENAVAAFYLMEAPEKVDLVTMTQDGLSDVPDTDRFLFINLKDARDSESRPEMLLRHNDFMKDMVTKLQKEHGNVVAVYTGKESSWTNSHRVRRQVGNNSDTNDYVLDGLRLYARNIKLVDGDNTIALHGLTSSTSEINSTALTLKTTLNFDSNSIVLNFKGKSGYWFFETVTLSAGTPNEEDLHPIEAVYALDDFAYRCAQNVSFINGNSSRHLFFEDLKVQPVFHTTNESSPVVFGDSFNCVGFFSAPIWSGLFVVFILLSITFYGIMMMMDIRTMDRFDDPKGKTITISAE